MAILARQIDSYIGMIITDNSSVSGMLTEGGLDIPDDYTVIVVHNLMEPPEGFKPINVASILHVSIARKTDDWYRHALPSERMKFAIKKAWLDSGVRDADMDDALL